MDDVPHENPNRPREYHGGRTLLVAVLVVLAAAAAVWLATTSGGSPSLSGDFGIIAFPNGMNPAALPIAAEPDALAPDFELETLDGERFRLSDLRGRPILLNFWASWCAPCRRETPVLIRLQEQYRADGFLVVGVNIEEARGPARDFVEAFGITYPVPMDFTGEVTDTYLRIGPPNSFFIDTTGMIRTAVYGQAPDDAFETETAALVRAARDANASS